MMADEDGSGSGHGSGDWDGSGSGDWDSVALDSPVIGMEPVELSDMFDQISLHTFRLQFVRQR